MLAAPNRLTDGRTISRVFSRGRYAAVGPFVIRAATHGEAPSRAVVVVSKKVSKKAVVRNRIRRRVAAQLATDWKTVVSGYDIVVSVREDIAEAKATDITEPLTAALTKLNLLTT